ncbi:monovalent cation/H(+) antiporter subunit G [Citrifermentans bremense]|uniref:monovalent cation/H(+) antiporter subunit G n=1 Tax=Citrifermentans bremense TaxID=60035 RepID=UPI000406FFAD|nr:monovalent cation/H(+) antiporter subunit G [Citrifermentans bremense]
MTPDVSASPVSVALLLPALFICAFCCLALAVMKGFYVKLHYLAPPAVLAGALVTAAIAFEEGTGANAVKAGLVLLVLLIGNPVITFAAARAYHLRQVSRQEAEDGKREEEAQKDGEDGP